MTYLHSDYNDGIPPEPGMIWVPPSCFSIGNSLLPVDGYWSPNPYNEPYPHPRFRVDTKDDPVLWIDHNGVERGLRGYKAEEADEWRKTLLTAKSKTDNEIIL